MNYLYGIAAAVLIALGACGMHFIDSAQYARLNAKFADYRAQVETQSAQAERLRADEIEKIQRDAHEAAISNARIIESMKHENLNLVNRNLELARRVLAGAAAPAGAREDRVPEGADNGSADAQGPAGSAQRLGGLLAECELNENDYDALVEELLLQRPLLELTP